MKIKTSEAISRVLDWLVAKAERYPPDPAWLPECDIILWRNYVLLAPFSPSTNWSQGGPIGEREKIGASWSVEGHWMAYRFNPDDPLEADHLRYGPTELVAKMRCFVASRLGDEVEVPDELLVS